MTPHLIPPQFRMTRFSASIFLFPPLPFSYLPSLLQASNWHFIVPISLSLTPISPQTLIFPHFFPIFCRASSSLSSSFNIHLTFPSSLFLAFVQKSPLLHLILFFLGSICISLCVSPHSAHETIFKLDLKCTFLSKIQTRYG